VLIFNLFLFNHLKKQKYSERYRENKLCNTPRIVQEENRHGTNIGHELSMD